MVGLLFKRQTSSAAMPLISEARESHADIFLLSFFTNINFVFDFLCVKHLETYILVDFVTNEQIYVLSYFCIVKYMTSRHIVSSEKVLMINVR